MGFNFGAFAGGLAKGGADTYVMLKEQERKDAEAKRQEDVHAAFLKEQAQKTAIDQAATETYGKVGMRQDAMGGAMGPQMPAQPNPSMPQPDGSTGAAPAGLPMGDNKTFESPAYTQEQAAKDYQNKLMGISPKEALSNRLQAAQTTGAEQGVEKGKYELGNLKANADLGTWLSEQHKTLAEKGPVAALEANLAAYNKESVHNDGMIASIVKGADGTSSLVRTDEKTGKVKDSTPITDATAQQAIQGMAFNKWKAIPGNFEKGLEHELKSRTAGAQETSAAAAAKNADTQAAKLAADIEAGIPKAQAAQAWAMVNHYNSDSTYRQALAKSLGEKTGNWSIIGTDADGQPISYDKNTGMLARADAKPIQSTEVFKRLTGEKTPKEPISNKDLIDFRKEFSETLSNEMDRKTGKAIPIGQLSLDMQRKYAEDYFNKGAGTTGGLKSDVKPEARNPEPPAASAKTALPLPTQPAVASGLPTDTPMPIKSVAYGKTVYKMPGVLGGFDTPAQAQAAWTKKNAALAPLSFTD